MRDYLRKLYPKNRTFLIIYIAVAVVLLLAIYFVFWGSKTSADVFTVKIGEIKEIIPVTGKTEALDSVNMSFDRTGRIVSVPVKVGDTVSVGQTLAVLDQGSASASVMQAQAQVDAQQAKFDQLKKGNRPEDLNTYASKRDSAAATFNAAKQTLIDAIRDAFSKVDDSIKNKTDKFFNGPYSSTPIFEVYAITNSQTITFDANFDSSMKVELSRRRYDVGQSLKKWKDNLAKFTVDSDLVAAGKEATANVQAAQGLIELMSVAMNSTASNDLNYRSILDSYKSDVSAARSTVNLAMNNLTAAYGNFTTSKANLDTAQSQYDLEKNGATAEELKAQQAQLEQAQGQLMAAQSELSRTVIVAPFSGLVTKQEAKVGEMAVVGTPLVAMISPDNLQIETNIAEVDIGKIAVGNPVKITLDAFPKETFDGKVIYIDPAATTIDGVVYYKSKVVFTNSDKRLKSGLTANLDIQTTYKPNVLVVPQYAITENDQGSFVQKLDGGSAVMVPVKTGLRDQTGMTEIVSGLKDGDRILSSGVSTSSK